MKETQEQNRIRSSKKGKRSTRSKTPKGGKYGDLDNDAVSEQE